MTPHKSRTAKRVLSITTKRSVVVKNEPDRPWISSGLKVSIDHMFELLQISKTSQSLEDHEKYKIVRSIVKDGKGTKDQNKVIDKVSAHLNKTKV